MTDPRWPAGARAARRALDALDALAAASSPLRYGGHALVELTGDPLQSLTAAPELPQPLEAALARLDQPAPEAANRAAVHRPPAPARPRLRRPALPPEGAWRLDGESRPRAAERRVEATRPVAPAADPEAVKRAVTSALAQVAPAMRNAVRPASAAVSPRWQELSPPSPAGAAVRAPLPPGDGIAGFAAQLAGGDAVMRQPLALDRARADEADPAGSSENRTENPAAPAGGPPHGAAASPASAPPRPAPRRTAIATPAGPADPAPPPTASAAPRNLAELVEHWSHRNPAATIAPSADLIPVAGAPADRGPRAAAPPVGTVIARVADEPPRTGELIALDALTHAIERVLVAEVRRHGLVVEES